MYIYSAWRRTLVRYDQAESGVNISSRLMVLEDCKKYTMFIENKHFEGKAAK